MPKKMYVVFCENDGTYWCGLNTWDKQLRKAKVFHSLKYANEVAERFKQLKLKNLEIRMDLVPENPTNADRIRAMSDEELAKHFSGLICDIDEGVEYHENPNTWLEWLKQPAEEVQK